MSSPAPRTVDTLTEKAGEQPDKTALIDDRPDGRKTIWSYAELERRANRLAHRLLEAGLESRERVLWCGKNSPDVVTLGHASRKAGLTSVPLNYRLTPEEAAYVTDNSDAVLAWIDAEQVELFEKIRDEIPKVRDVVVFDGEPGKGMLSAEEWVDASSEGPVPPPRAESRSMIYTSGTTGKPKGAVRTGTGDPEQLTAMVAHIGYSPDDVYLTTGPVYHSGPGGFMGISFLLGNTVVLQRRFDPEDWLRLLETYRVTSTFSAPTPIRMICNVAEEVKARYDRSSMRVMVANAAPWPYALKQAYCADFGEESLFEIYGSTEMGVNMILRPEDQLRKPGSCGKPAPMIDVKLIGDDGEEVTEPKLPGEVFVRSRSMFNTYHKAQEKYEAETRGEYHTVGDVAFFDEEGYYYICDRKNDMIISGGMNIYPAEIEAALEQHPDIFEAAVFGVPSEQWGESVHAVVVLKGELDEDAISAFAHEHLAGYKVPRSLSFAQELPKTGSGKILKRELRKPFWEGHESQVL